MRNRYLFLVLAISVAVLLSLPLPRALLVFSVGSLVRGLNKPLCYSIPEAPRPDDPPIPNESQRKISLTSSETLVSQVAKEVFGKEFVYAQAGEARSLMPRGEFEQGDEWIDVWTKNGRWLRIDEQREHWDPKISEVSRRVFQRSAVDGLEFRMYHSDNLTYWVRTARDVETSAYLSERDWYQVRYSECKEAF